MKTKCLLLTIMVMLFSEVNGQVHSLPDSKKILVAYFSQSGNTETAANYISELAHADVFRIEAVTSYPKAYQALVDQAKKEIETGYKPAIKGQVKNFSDYNLIFIGSPCWWSTIAPPVSTFLSSYDFSGKIIIPFMTHEGSRMGRSVSDIKKICPRANVLAGLPIRGGSVNGAKEDVKKWLEKLGILK